MAGNLDPRAAGGRRLDNKVCIVTGSGQGIGKATAKRLGEEGGRIVVAERIDETASATVALLEENGVEALKVLADVSTFAGAQQLMDDVMSAWGHCRFCRPLPVLPLPAATATIWASST